MVLSFAEDKLGNIVINQSQTALYPQQEEIMKLMVMTMHELIPNLSLIALKGMFRLSIKEFVKRTGINPRTLIEIPVSEAKPGIKIIFDILEEKLSLVLRNKTDEEILAKAVNNGYCQVIDKRAQMEKLRSD